MDNLNVQDISVDSIDEPAHAMRVDIDRDKVFELSASIKENGLINPITVRPVRDRYEVVAGHRRFLAHRYGGMPTIKCVVRNLTDTEAAAVMASENYDREDTNPIDDAANVVHLLEVYDGDVERVAKIVRRSGGWVEDRVLIHNMPDYMKVPLKEGKLKLGVALTLNKITDDIDRESCVGMAISQGATNVTANYWLSQWQLGIFGHATIRSEPEDNGSGAQRRIVTLRCKLSDKDWPADEMRTVFVHTSMLGYVDAMREAIKSDEHANSMPTGGETIAAHSVPQQP